MKIKSRPDDEDVVVIGGGSCQLNLTDDQLQLIAALVYNTRLGQNSAFSVAAYEIVKMLEDTYGSDFLDDSASQVGLEVTIEDDKGNVVLSTKSGLYYPTLEV